MSDATRDNSAVPSLIERETTDVQAARMMTPGEKITFLLAKYESLKERTPTHEDVRDEITGARRSLETTIAALAPKERLERAEERIDTLATKEALVDLRNTVVDLRNTVDSIKPKPPNMGKLAAGAFGFLLTLATIIWQASARVGDVSLQTTILKMQVDGLNETVKRLEAAQQATQSKLDQLLIHGAKP